MSYTEQITDRRTEIATATRSLPEAPEGVRGFSSGEILAWSGDDGRFAVRLQMRSGVAVLTLVGQMNREAIQACRSGLEAVLLIRASHVVLDLSGTQVNEYSQIVLRLIAQIVARNGVSLRLAGVTAPARAILRTDRTAAYRVFSHVERAVQDANATTVGRRSSR
jgi:hypothetical protein